MKGGAEKKKRGAGRIESGSREGGERKTSQSHLRGASPCVVEYPKTLYDSVHGYKSFSGEKS